MNKAKYWQAIMYPENMIDDWQDEISNLLQVPYAYCIHDKDLEKDNKTPRKIHIHIITAYSNTTTENHALKVFQKLQKDGCCAIPNNHIEDVINIRHAYDYLIHDTEDCKKKHKFLYPVSERIIGNNFDIGNFEQLGTAQKNDMARELCDVIIEKGYCNFSDFYMDIITNFDTSYFEILKTNSGLFERLTKGNYQKLKFTMEKQYEI